MTSASDAIPAGPRGDVFERARPCATRLVVDALLRSVPGMGAILAVQALALDVFAVMGARCSAPSIPRISAISAARCPRSSR